MSRTVMRAALGGVALVSCVFAGCSEARAQAAPGCIVPLSQIEDGPVKNGGSQYPFVGRLYGDGDLQRCIPIPVVEANDPPYPPGYEGPPIPQLWPIEQAVGPSIHDPSAYDASLFMDVFGAILKHVDARSVYLLDAQARLGALQTPGKLGTPDLSAVPVPADFPDEPIAALNARTRRVEFEVPRGEYEIEVLPDLTRTDLPGLAPFIGPYERVEDADPTSPTLRLRGWFIEGDDDGAAGAHPLVVILHGAGHDPFVESGPRGSSPGYRDLAYEAASAGFDVLMFSLRGYGVSEGSSPSEPEDVFEVLDQLASGCLALGPEPGAVPQVEQLVASAQDTPVVLWGFSQGGVETQTVMTRNLVDARGYDLRGAVLMSSAVGSLYYRSSLTPYQNASAAVNVGAHHGKLELEPDTLDEVAAWPGLLVVHGTDDAAYSLRGAVEMFNRAGGIKSMYTYVGSHGDALSPARVAEVARRAVRFSRAVIDGEVPPATAEARTTTVDLEVVRALSGDDGGD